MEKNYSCLIKKWLPTTNLCSAILGANSRHPYSLRWLDLNWGLVDLESSAWATIPFTYLCLSKRLRILPHNKFTSDHQPLQCHIGCKIMKLFQIPARIAVTNTYTICHISDLKWTAMSDGQTLKQINKVGNSKQLSFVTLYLSLFVKKNYEFCLILEKKLCPTIRFCSDILCLKSWHGFKSEAY